MVIFIMGNNVAIAQSKDDLQYEMKMLHISLFFFSKILTSLALTYSLLNCSLHFILINSTSTMLLYPFDFSFFS
jgi:hypothetical protein